MPTIFFLAIAYQIQGIRWRYFFLAAAAVSLVFHIYHQAWAKEIYPAVTVLLLFTLNTYFISWWNKRNARNNPSSFWQFAKDIFLVTKHNKFIIFYWLSVIIVSIVLICLYTGYTGFAFLGWLLGIYITLFVLKKLFYSILPPEWFLHDINTNYVFMSVFIGWIVSELMYPKLGDHFILPMFITAALCVAGIYLLDKKIRYLVPGCSIVLADMIWQVIRMFQSGIDYTPQFILTEAVLILAMIVGLYWLLKKPGTLPIIYLSLFQLFRFSAFSYEAINRLTSETLSVYEVTYYILYLVCWMYIIPLIFWFSGLMQHKDAVLIEEQMRVT